MSDPEPDEVEIARATLAGEELECTVRAGVFEDVSLWGRVLADLARNVALGLVEEDGRNPAEVLRAIRDAFDADLDTPPGEES